MKKAEQTTAAVMERLKAALIKKYGNMSAASIANGRGKSYLTDFFFKKENISVKSLVALAEWADVSPRYVLNGGRALRWQAAEASFKNLFDAFESADKAKLPRSIKEIVCGLIRGERACLSVKTLLTFAELTNTDPAFLIGIE